MNRLQSGTRVFVSTRGESIIGTLVNDFDGCGAVILRDVVFLAYSLRFPDVTEQRVEDLIAQNEAKNLTHEVFVPLNAIEFVTKLPEVKQ